MDCDAVVKRLDIFRTGELKEHEQHRVTRHLAACRECEEELAAMEQLNLHLSQLQVPAPEAVLQRVLAGASDRYGQIQTELGVAWIAYNTRGIARISLGDQHPVAFEATYKARFGRRPRPAAVPERYARAVRKAAAGKASHRPPVDLTSLSPFDRRVLRLLEQIPRGEVRPYSWVAREVGHPRAVRAVGNAVARNPLPLLLPCHRVVPLQGGVGRYGFGSSVKRDLLLREGVAVDELEDLARRRIRFVGSSSTKIYCFPTCRDARRIRTANRVIFTSEEQAGQSGYRPCRRCRPLAV